LHHLFDRRSECYPTDSQKYLITPAEIYIYSCYKLFPVQRQYCHIFLPIVQHKSRASIFQRIRLCSIILMTGYRSVSNSAGYFPMYFVSDTFKSKSRCLLEVCNVLVALMDNITFQGASKSIMPR
jgi:hypothetical protein